VPAGQEPALLDPGGRAHGGECARCSRAQSGQTDSEDL
jgi:hypothetical protein